MTSLAITRQRHAVKKTEHCKLYNTTYIPYMYFIRLFATWFVRFVLKIAFSHPFERHQARACVWLQFSGCCVARFRIQIQKAEKEDLRFYCTPKKSFLALKGNSSKRKETFDTEDGKLSNEVVCLLSSLSVTRFHYSLARVEKKRDFSLG